MKLPPQIPKSVAPSVTSRYNDFMATHINNAPLIHTNGVFLSWHRHFLYLFQKALTEEYGFQGAVPYWNWPWWADDLASSPLFDGSETRISGDGYWNASMPPMQNPNYTFSRGNGGGCISSGPFTNITTGFRMFENSEILRQTLPEDALEYNPRCVTSELNSDITSFNHRASVVDDLLSARNIEGFQKVLEGTIRNTSILSPHIAGHWSVGLGMQDQYASPSDPAFYLHHFMIDNMWAQWQLQHPRNLTFALARTVTTLDNPPSQSATPDFVTSFEYLDKPRKLRELMDTYGGQYCYRYQYEQSTQQPCWVQRDDILDDG
jgi:tyrosinase